MAGEHPAGLLSSSSRAIQLPLKGKRRPQAVLNKRIKEIAETRVRYGYRRIHVLLRREGWRVNAKRVWRLYREMGLQLRNKTPKRRVKAKLREGRSDAVRPNEVWAMDFVHDQLFDGRKIRALTIIDTFTRLSPAIDVRQSYRGADVVATLERAAAEVGLPKTIRVDNGPEFVSKELDLWAFIRGVTLDLSRPGKPTDNAYIEPFNGKFRAANWFLSLDEARQKCEAWRRDYNPASEHPSVYAIEVKRLCWARSDPVGYRALRCARSTRALTASPSTVARAKIQGPSVKG